MHPDDRKRMQAEVARSIADKTDYDIQYRVLKPDGTIGWVMVRGHPEFDGERPSMFGISLDVTESRLLTEQLALSEAALRLATDAAEIGTWDLDLTTEILTWSDRTKRMFGISAHVPCSMDDFYSGLHPEDLDATSAAFASAIDPARRATYDVEYRTVGKEDGIIRWVAAKGRGIFDENGRCVRAIGTAIDISRRKEAEAEQALLLQELKHRMKNTLSMVQAIVNQTLQSQTDPKKAKDVVGKRLKALSSAQDVLTRTDWDGAMLAEVVDGAIAATDEGRFEIEGPDVALDPRRALAMSLALHELITNAAKYGALSTAAGRVRINWDVETGSKLVFAWVETGGPLVSEPTRKGFGSRIIGKTLASYFDGETTTIYDHTGLRFSLTAPLIGSSEPVE